MSNTSICTKTQDQISCMVAHRGKTKYLTDISVFLLFCLFSDGLENDPKYALTMSY